MHDNVRLVALEILVIEYLKDQISRDYPDHEGWSRYLDGLGERVEIAATIASVSRRSTENTPPTLSIREQTSRVFRTLRARWSDS